MQYIGMITVVNVLTEPKIMLDQILQYVNRCMYE